MNEGYASVKRGVLFGFSDGLSDSELGYSKLWCMYYKKLKQTWTDVGLQELVKAVVEVSKR